MNKTDLLLELLIDVVIATHEYEDLSEFKSRLHNIINDGRIEIHR